MYYGNGREAKIRTSYFAKYKESDGVSIALITPFWFKGESYRFLAPTWKILEEIRNSNHTLADQATYEEKYRKEILSKLDPRLIAQCCEGKVLLCYEKTGKFCHRHIVARWLKETLNIDVIEV